jgi:hypothetical protein
MLAGYRSGKLDDFDYLMRLFIGSEVKPPLNLSHEWSAKTTFAGRNIFFPNCHFIGKTSSKGHHDHKLKVFQYLL